MLTLVSLSAPIFFLFAVLEWWVAKKKGKYAYQFSDAIANTAAGIADRMFDFFYAIVLLFVLRWIYDHFAIFVIPRTIWVWVLCMIAWDFLFYWYHRLGHETNFFWAIHIVHHQSEEYNLTVAARNTIFQHMFKTIFLALLPFIGFAPEFVWTCYLVLGVYQFFLHTRLVPSLGWWEYIFVTPSLHRVHHARNEEYLDRNYGGVLIIWDIFFGTYKNEQTEVRYGITTGFPSRNVYWSYFHYWVDLYRLVRDAPGWKNKLKAFYKPPGWTPEDMQLAEPEKPKPLDRPKYDPVAPAQLNVYVLLHSFIALLLLTGMLVQKGNVTGSYASLKAFYTEYMSTGEVIAYAFFIFLATLTVPVLLERKKWAYYLEHARLLIMAVGVPFFLLGMMPGKPLASLITGVFLAFNLWLYRMKYIFDESPADASAPSLMDGNQ